MSVILFGLLCVNRMYHNETHRIIANLTLGHDTGYYEHGGITGC